MKVQAEITVVIPVYNNQDSLKELAERLVRVLTAFGSYEVVFVDDGSRDNSNVILREIAGANSSIKLITLSKNFGQHPAISAGFENASGKLIVLMDADLQDTPEDIPKLVSQLQATGSEIVYSTKKMAGMSLGMRPSSAFYHWVFSKIVKTPVPQNIGTFRLFTRKFLNELLRFKEVNILFGPLMFYMGYPSSFVELPYRERVHGKSSYSFSKRLSLALNSLISYTSVPHKIFAYFGGGLITASFLYGLIVLLQFVLVGSPLPSGYTLIIMIMLVTSGSLMVFCGIIGGYVFRVYQEVLNRPRYLIKDIVNE